MILDIAGIISFIQLIQGIANAFLIMINTPPQFTLDLIQPLWQVMAGIANLLMGSFLIVGIVQIMIGRSTGKITTMTMQELITRFVVQIIAINSSMEMIRILVNIENDLCLGVLTYTGTTIGVLPNDNNVATFFLNFFMERISLMNMAKLLLTVPSAILVLIAIIFIVVLFLVFFQSVVRLLHLNLFIALIPLALLFLLVEQTRGYGAFIIKMLIITIFVQFIQVLAFCLAVLTLSSALTNGALGDPVIKVIMAIGQLIGVYTVPKLLSHFGIESSASGVIKATFLAARAGLKLAGAPVS